MLGYFHLFSCVLVTKAFFSGSRFHNFSFQVVLTFSVRRTSPSSSLCRGGPDEGATPVKHSMHDPLHDLHSYGQAWRYFLSVRKNRSLWFSNLPKSDHPKSSLRVGMLVLLSLKSIPPWRLMHARVTNVWPTVGTCEVWNQTVFFSVPQCRRMVTMTQPLTSCGPLPALKMIAELRGMASVWVLQEALAKWKNVISCTRIQDEWHFEVRIGRESMNGGSVVMLMIGMRQIQVPSWQPIWLPLLPLLLNWPDPSRLKFNFLHDYHVFIIIKYNL